MAESGCSNIKKLLGDVLDKLTSLETKLTTAELRLPEYDGTDDPDVWLHRCELFFRLQRTKEDSKVCLAAFHMTGKAQIWYCGLKRNHGVVPTWPEFAASARRRFSDPARGKSAFGELIKVRHTGSVAEYWEEFMALLDRCDGVSEPLQVGLFIAYLRDPLRGEVEQRSPETLKDAAWLACALEHLQEPGSEN